jgi:hypothetical protein
LHGTLSGTVPDLTYTPNSGFTGDDSFTFTVTDRGDPDGCTGSPPACSIVLTSPVASVIIHVEAAVPVLTSISPASAQAGDPDVTLSLTGSGFLSASQVKWNGTTGLVTTYVDAQHLTAVITASLLDTVQTAQITIYTPAPGGGTSNILAFFVTEEAAVVIDQDVASGDDPTASSGTVTADATGSGLLVVAEYDANPGGVPSFSASGAYFDVYAAPDSSFSEVSIVACGLNGGDHLYWWDAVSGKWEKASPQTYDPDTGCITLTVTGTSSPSFSDLSGTVFDAGTVPFASQVTDGTYCISDRYPDTLDREFRLLFTPDMQNYPASKLMVSNPGQFYYNVFYKDGGESTTIDVTIPYPFVTQGATPAHTYSSVSVYTNDKGETCVMPGEDGDALPAEITLESYANNGTPGTFGDSVTLTFTDLPVDPVTGLVYLNLHLDFGLKDPDLDANGDGEVDRYEKQGRLVNGNMYYDAANFEYPTEILIEDRFIHTFTSNIDPDGDTIVNQNEFKVTPGVAGFVFEPVDGGFDVYTVGDLTVRLVIPESVNYHEPYLETTPDEDGWYMIDYKHLGRPTNYKFEVYRDSELLVEKTVQLKGNEFEEVHIYLNEGSGGGGTTYHYVYGLLGSSKVTGRSWNATVLVTILDQDDALVPNAQVSGIWTVDGDEEPGFCVTDESGTCKVTLSKIDSVILNVSFRVTDVFVEGSIYDADGSVTDIDVAQYP